MSEQNQNGAHEEHNEFLTVKQLAAVLQISEASVRRLAHSGRIPSIRLSPRLIRFHLPSVREALDSTHHRSRKHHEHEEDNRQLSFTDLL
jgi:excisionase family DNA binding protein